VCLPRRSAGGLSPADKRSTVQGLPEQKGQPKMRLLYGRVHNDVRLDKPLRSLVASRLRHYKTEGPEGSILVSCACTVVIMSAK